MIQYSGSLVNPDMFGIATTFVTVMEMFLSGGTFFLLTVSLIEHCFVVFVGHHNGFDTTMKKWDYYALNNAAAVPLQDGD